MYIPEGRHEINARVGGNPRSFISNLPAEKGEEIAAKFQSALNFLLAENVSPFFDFEHKGGKASAWPKKFFYVKGKGLMCDAEWTGSGVKARRKRDFRYFSPTYLVDDESGEPYGIPSRGPLGALVNDPAFREIERVAAGEAKPKETTPKKTMNDLVTTGLLTEAEAAQADAQSVAASRVSTLRAEAKNLKEIEASNTSLTAENTKLKAQIAEASENDAKETVKLAVAAGRLLAGDEASQAYWTKQIVTNPVEAKAALDAIPAQNDQLLKKKIIEAGGSNQTPTNGDGALLLAANKLVEAGTAKTQEQALTMAASANPALYEEYAKTL